MAHWILKETKQQLGSAGTGNMLGCCLVSFHFLWAILSTSTVLTGLHGEDDEHAGHDPRAVVVLELEAQLHGEVVRVQGV